MFEHVNRPEVFERMLTIRDRLGDLYEENGGNLTEEEQRWAGELFKGDRTLFRFMDEQPGHFLLRTGVPFGVEGRYVDGKGREGWHIVLRQLRNDSDVFWQALRGEEAS